MDKRFIEESFPVQEVSEESAKEKNIRHGHISTLHIWWARRPLASSRSTNYAALIPAASDEIDWIKKRNFIIELSKWENSSNKNLIEKAKSEILNSNNGNPPKVLDPFSGGGAIPLEALRLGCETYANDYNPVASLIEKCTLEYPLKYGQSNQNSWSQEKNKLIEDIKKWGNWVLNETFEDIGKFFENDDDGSIPNAYIWARTIKCQNPECNNPIPILRQFWLARSKTKNVYLKPNIFKDQISFEIVETDKTPKNFDPSKGTISKAIVQCPFCNSTIEAKNTRKLFKENKVGQQIIAIVLSKPKQKGKFYRTATKEDIVIYNQSKVYFEEKRKKLSEQLGSDPVPDEFIHTPSNKEYGEDNLIYYNFTPIVLYGMTKWKDLFNSRQKLVLITFAEKIRQLYKKLIDEGTEKDYAKAVTSYIGLVISRMPDTNSKICHWDGSWQKICTTFARQAIPMNWDYIEANPFSGKGYSFKNILENNIIKTVQNLSLINNKPAIISNSSATNLPFNENFFDAVFTDPPYYDNIPYSNLSDFFYVWQKRIFGDIHPNLFLTPLTPKNDETIAELPLLRGMKKDEAVKYLKGIKTSEHFEKMLSKSFKEIYRVLKPNGIATIVYAHKTTEGWETVINSLLDSGLTVTASWPLSTEMKSRLRAQKSAALASSIYIIARKIEKKDIGWFKDVKEEVKEYIPQKLDKLWEEGISGADFFISAIGSSIEVFGLYSKVLDNEGNEIRANKLLSFVRDVVTNYAVRHILHNDIANLLSPLTKFYILWRWNYQEARVQFDEARKLAQSAGIDLSNEWNKGFIVKKGEFITVNGPDKRDKKSLKNSKELIDVLHHVCLLWKEGKTDEMKSVLKESGYGESEALYKVAQAISETLPNSSSEKKLIEGFLAGKEKLMQDMKVDEPQTKLL